MLARTDRGVELHDGKERRLPFDHAQIEQGAKVDLGGLTISLKSTATLPSAAGIGAGVPGGIFRVYHQIRGWTLGSVDLGSSYSAEVNGGSVFRVTSSGAEYLLTAYSPEMIQVSTDKAVHELGFGRALILTEEELSRITIRSGIYQWTFNRPDRVMVPPAARSRDYIGIARREIQGVVAVAAALFAATFLWPESNEAPKQFQIVQVPQVTLRKPVVAKKTAAMGSGVTAARKSPEKSGKPNAAPAFQGEKLQSAMKGLFRGGMTQLLAKSEYAPGADKSDGARKLFHSSSPALHSTAPLTGPGIGSGTRVSAIGGGGEGTGKGVGYGHGEHANVQGQGKSYVAMDTTGSSVEEGLSKDEVGKVIHRHMSEVRYCYEASILRNPELEGKLVLGFTIGASGKVKVAGVRSSTLSDSNLDDCIVRRLSAWKFPNTKGGIDVGVTYPFIFKTIGG